MENPQPPVEAKPATKKQPAAKMGNPYREGSRKYEVFEDYVRENVFTLEVLISICNNCHVKASTARTWFSKFNDYIKMFK